MNFKTGIDLVVGWSRLEQAEVCGSTTHAIEVLQSSMQTVATVAEHSQSQLSAAIECKWNASEIT